MSCGKDIVVALLKGDVVTFAISIPILYLPACYLDYFFLRFIWISGEAF